MKDWSKDLLHHEQMLYISVLTELYIEHCIKNNFLCCCLHVVGLKVKVYPTFDTILYTILNAIGYVFEDLLS